MRLTQLAHGLPVGGELDWLDDGTLAQALRARTTGFVRRHMMGVTGVGGIFLRADDPKALSAWYAEHLGVGDGKWGMWEQQAGTTVFSPFARDSDYFPADRQIMLNYRVDGLDALLARLRASGGDRGDHQA